MGVWQGKEDALAAVALSVADLRSWLAEVDAVSDDDHRVVHTRGASAALLFCSENELTPANSGLLRWPCSMT
jgi:hypothetical protein